MFLRSDLFVSSRGAWRGAAFGAAFASLAAFPAADPANRLFGGQRTAEIGSD